MVNFWKRPHSVETCTELGKQRFLLFFLKGFAVVFCLTHSKQSVRNVQQQGKVCVLDIEIEGVKQIRNTDLNPLLVFIMPPSLAELERRLRGRNTETEESLQKRLNTAKIEMEYGLLPEIVCKKNHHSFKQIAGALPGNFDVIVPNKHLKSAYTQLRNFVVKELETQRDQGINVQLHQVELPPSP